MPHVIVEHSANFAERTDINALLQCLHQAALETGVFPIGGLRTRAVSREHYVIADDHPDNAFVYVVLRIGHGRDDETKQKAGQHMFDALCQHLTEVFDSSALSIGMEIQEVDPVLSYKHNNLHTLVKARSSAS